MLKLSSAILRQVLLVGGATRMPAIRRFVRNMTGLDPAEFVVDPDLVGARLVSVYVIDGLKGGHALTAPRAVRGHPGHLALTVRLASA